MAALEILKSKLERLRVVNPPFIRGAKKQLNLLEVQLNQILMYEDDRQKWRDSMRELMSKAIDMALHCNFIIDTFISDAEVSISRAGLLRKLFLRCLGKVEGFDKFKEEFESITRDIQEVKIMMEISSQRAIGDKRPERTRRVPPIVKESDVVGLEEDVEFLLNEAISTDGLSTICVVGMGGIGKTTLASIVYHHPAVAANFEIRAWITLSREFYWEEEALTELIAVLQTATGDEAKMRYGRDQLRQRVYQLLSGRKYFIVLDEAWAEIDLLDFLDAFPKDSSSVLLITSRNQRVIRRPSCFHQLKVLDAKKSWEMFSKKAFPRDGKCPKHLEEIGKQIVKRCDGLPLAIEEAAQLLQQEKADPKVWEKFLESMDLKRTSTSLGLSYNKLYKPHKPGFLSLAFFREGTTIKTQKLLQLWVAGELVPYSEDGYESGKYYLLKNLIDQSLIQVKDRVEHNDISDNLRRLNINNNVRKLAISKAIEEIRLEVLSKRRSYDGCLGKRRYLVIYLSREKFNYSLDQDQQLLSIVFHGGGDVDASPSQWKNLKVLKILDWEGFGLKIVPIGVETIVSLKYLGLRNNYIRELCSLLGQLNQLEVLDIAQNFLVEVPNIIWEMDNLHHLYMSDIICKNPLNIHALKNLQTLTYISLDNWAYNLSGLKMMTSLYKLGIEEVDGNTDARKLYALVVELKGLRHLILKGFRFRRMHGIEEVYFGYGLQHLKLDGLLTRLPCHFFGDIFSLSLVNSRLDDDPMPTLKKISWLKYLKLQNAYSGKQMVISCNGFEKLKSLSIKELWHLRSVQVEQGAMQKLDKLEIISCPYLDTLPEEIGSMSSLRELNMVTTKRIATMIRKKSFISKIRKVDIQP